MIAYSYNDNMEYIGTVECQKDPVRSQREGKECHLLPANATFSPPPAYDHDAEIPVWDGTKWTNQMIPETPDLEPTPEPEVPVTWSALAEAYQEGVQEA